MAISLFFILFGMIAGMYEKIVGTPLLTILVIGVVFLCIGTGAVMYKGPDPEKIRLLCKEINENIDGDK